MGLFDKFKKKPESLPEDRGLPEPTAKPEMPKVKKPRKPKAESTPKPRKKKVTPKAENPDKIAATERGEPWVSIINIDLDPDNIGNGAFELDWNDKFIAQLVRAGYQSQPNEADNIIVDRWFQTVCRNILAENYEQWEANYYSGRRVDVEDLGDGKTSVS